jgi:hypothetical protein
MAKKKNLVRSEGPTPLHKIVTATEARDILGVDETAVIYRKINEISELLFVHDGLSTNEKNVRVVRALELYEGLNPADGAESMLAAQMVATHNAALDCFRRAAITDQTFAGRNMALGHAQKLLSLYAKQLATLDKHRGKGQQKITVERVNVASGGQAIVGNVETGTKNAEAEPPKMIESNPAEIMPEIPLTEAKPKAAVSRKKS